MLAGETEGAREPHDATWDPTVEERAPAAMARNRVYAFAGTSTLIQALGQTLYTSLALAQHFCLIDFLKEFHILIYLRILYFHNPGSCGQRINIGEAIDGIANQAFVLLSHEPFTAFRTCIINCIGLGLSVVWITASIIFMKGAASSSQSKLVKWPWVTVTVAMCALDLVATITYTNDSFHTRTLSDTMDFIGGTVTGVGNVELNTSWASWTMVLFYSRFIVFFFMNVILLVMVIVDNVEHKENVAVQVEAPTMVHTSVTTQAGNVSDPDSEDVSLNLRSASRIPRPGLSQSFRKMKTLLFGRSFTLDQQSRSDMDSLDMSPETSRTVPVELDKKRTVNFPDNLLSLPQRLENMIAEQQRRLNRAVVNTAGRAPADTSAHMDDVSVLIEGKSRRNMKNMELQGQLPWAYIPASSHPMRDQLPPDEDLPPVPLPDYTAMPSVRKASVHRAASSLSSLTQKRGYSSTQHGDDEDF